MERILTRELTFVDESGRERIFNGMNIDDKRIGDTFLYPLDRAFFEKYTANGFNLIRLAITWANLEPQPEQYSESYLSSLDEIFRLAEEFGVYILLDMHQDLYSGFDGVGGGDGAPLWACLTDGKQAKPYKFVWAEAYFFGAWVHNCFDHFWRNDKVDGRGLQDRYADLWRMLARRYGSSPALFGFDFLNEPAPGSLIKKTILQLLPRAVRAGLLSKQLKRRVLLAALLRGDMQTVLDNLPGAFMEEVTAKVIPAQAAFDKECYWPFLCKMAAAVREATPNGILMIEQPYLCNGGVRLSVPPIEVNGRREPLQCYGPHAYDFTVDTPLYQYANASRVKAFFCEMRNTQERLNVPVIVGEWGGSGGNGRYGCAADENAFAHLSGRGRGKTDQLRPQRRQNDIYPALCFRRRRRNAALCPCTVQSRKQRRSDGEKGISERCGTAWRPFGERRMFCDAHILRRKRKWNCCKRARVCCAM